MKVPEIVKRIQNTKLTPIDYSKQKNISFSQYLNYVECPQKWKLKFVDGHKKLDQSIHLIFGTAIHNTIQYYLQTMYDKSGAEADRIDIEKYFELQLKDEYLKSYERSKIHFSSKDEMNEFYQDGLNILHYLKKNRNKLYTKKGWYLVGVEIPLIKPLDDDNILIFNGYIDIVLYHEATDTIYIQDYKTSGKGWSEYDKKADKIKQLLFYKEYFSSIYNVPKDKIKVSYVILKRKLLENCDYPQKQIVEFEPAHGVYKIKDAINSMSEFINNCYNKDGSFIDKNHIPNSNKNSCRFCEFSKNNLCEYAFKE